MPRPLGFRRAELKRAIAAVRDATLHIHRVDIAKDGSFALVVDNPKPWSDSDDAVSITEAELKDLI